MGKVLDWAAASASGAKLTADLFEIQAGPGIDMLFSAADVFAAVVSSAGMSLFYDLCRNWGLIPSYGAIGIYQDDEGVWHIVSLVYSPDESGEEMLHLGDNLLDDLLQGGDAADD